MSLGGLLLLASARFLFVFYCFLAVFVPQMVSKEPRIPLSKSLKKLTYSVSALGDPDRGQRRVAG